MHYFTNKNNNCHFYSQMQQFNRRRQFVVSRRMALARQDAASREAAYHQLIQLT